MSFLNFIPKDSTFTINSIKIYTKNSSIFPDSFTVVKGFTWLDYKVICNPPRQINGIKLILEPNGTVTCRMTDIVKNVKNTKYMDTISTVFELGKYDDVVNLKGYTLKQKSPNLKIHLPSVNNKGRNTLKLQYDTLGKDSGKMIGEILFSRSTPDSAVKRLTIGFGFNNVCGAYYAIDFSDNGDYTIINKNTCGYFDINSVIRSGNDDKIRLNRTIDKTLASIFYLTITGYGRCSNIYPIIEKKYNY